MRTLKFKNEDDFIQQLDGKVYCIADETNSIFLCDILEEDFIRFINDGIIIDLNNNQQDFFFKNSYSDYFISSKVYLNEVFQRRVNIEF